MTYVTDDVNGDVVYPGLIICQPPDGKRETHREVNLGKFCLLLTIN